MSHVTIPSLKRTLSGGNVPPSMPSSHMSMNAAASLSQLATGDRSPRHGHRHEPPPSHGHAPMPHAYSGPHAGYSNHGHAPPVVGPPPMTRAVTASAAYNRQPPISSRMSTAPVNPQPSAAAPSRSQLPSSSGPPPQDWRMYLTIEERQAVRSKIQDAYTSTCKTYEELLQAASAIEEELLHIAAPSRLDYFKSGFEFENRVKLKREQLQGQLAALEKKNYASAPSSAPKGEGRTTNNNNKASPETAAKKPRKQ